MINARSLFLTSTSVVALSCPAAVFAQDAPPAPTDSATYIGEIVVTATRRDESILTVPLSVAAYDQEALDVRGVRDVEDLARITPGVAVTPGFGGQISLSIRGLTSSPGGAAMNGLYLNETPVQIRTLNLGSNFYPAVFDLERIEVLRGPQGTLFGSGSMGGALRYITRQPSVEDFSANLRAEAASTKGGDPSYEFAGAAGGPLVDGTLGYRVSVYQRRDVGYVDREPFTPGFGSAEEDSNARRTSVVNFGLAWRPTDRLEIVPSVFYQKVKQDDSDVYSTLLTDSSRPRYVSGDAFASTLEDEAVLPSIKVTVDLGGASLISNTAWLDRETRSINDASAFVLEVLGAPYNTDLGGAQRSTFDIAYSQEAFTQEVRLQSDESDDRRLSYVVGAFYQKTRQQAHERDLSPGLTALLFASADPLLYDLNDRIEDRQIAAFGQADYRLTDRLTLTAGARVAKMKYESSNRAFGPLAGAGTSSNGSTSETVVTPRFSAQYSFASDWMAYASAAKGFRPGGTNAPAPNTCAADLAALGLTQVDPDYDSDSVWGYEAGVKGRAGRSLSLAVSVFDIEWTDIQRARVLPTCVFLFQDNLGSARSAGFEAQAFWRPTEALTFGLSVGYTSAKFQETVPTEPGAATPGTIVRDGDRFAAPWLISLTADYERPLGGDGDLVGYAHLQYDYKKGFKVDPGNVGFDPEELRIDDTHFASARAGVRFDRVDLSVFADNLFNSDDVLSRSRVTTTTPRVLEQSFRPRTVGVTAAYRY